MTSSPAQASLLTDEPLDPVELAARAAQRGREGHFSEFHGQLNPRGGAAAPISPLWQHFLQATGSAGWLDLPHRAARVQRRVQEDGATYNVYDDSGQSSRVWPLKLLPMLVGAIEWAGIERGVQQRARLLNAALADVYGPRTLLDRGLLPASLVFAHPQYLRPLHGCRPLGGVHAHVMAFDLARGPDGLWWVIGQRTQAPSGLGYMLENRLIISQQFPEAFRDLSVQRLAASFRGLLQGLMRLSPQGERSRVALLTPGPHNETYFEHTFLARYLGITLVEGADLTVRNHRVYLKTLHGLERIHVLLRRVDDEYLDPLELRADSSLGVPGLIQAMRAGEVVVANAPGSGWLESPGLNAFWPGVAQALLGEDLLLPATASWWCGEAGAWEQHRDALQDFVAVPTFPGSGGARSFAPQSLAQLNAAERDALLKKLAADPSAYTLQARVQASETPVWHQGQLEARAAVLRVYALTDGRGGWQVLPGGLTRVAAARDKSMDSWLSMQRGSASTDTWVLTEGEVDTTSLLPQPLSAAELSAVRWPVSSRSAENLFWLGRYTERAENSVRLARLTLEFMATLKHEGHLPMMSFLDELARRHGLVGAEVPAATSALRVFERSLVHDLADTQGATSLAWNLSALQNCAQVLRERLSTEQWQLIHEVGAQLQRSFRPLLASPAPPPVADVTSALGMTATQLAAITGAQTDRMTRDDGWRLLSVGRQIERLDFLSHALSTGFARRLHESDEGFNMLLGLFDSTITYRAQFQGRREAPPLLHLLVHDADNPRSLTWVARTMRERFVKLSRLDSNWAQAIAAQLPRPEDWSLEALSEVDGQGLHQELITRLDECSARTQNLSLQIGRRLFAHVGHLDQVVWQ